MSDKESKNKDLIIVEGIAERIHFIRGHRVMLDRDLAEVYQVETRVLNQAVKRNLSRFPEDFMFQLTDDETKSLTSQIVTSNKGRGGRRYFPYVFTEHGAVMLASILKSQIAIDASIQVIRAFMQMRTILMLHADLAERIEELEQAVDTHDEKFKVVSQLLGQILDGKKRGARQIGFIDKKKN